MSKTVPETAVLPERNPIEKSPIGMVEFVILMAIMMSMLALSIDAMLPAFNDIARDLALEDPRDVQYVLSSMFAGLAVGQLFYGPISDSFGRKPTIYLAAVIFCAGCLLSIFTQNFEVMLIGRVLQGFGAAGNRIVIMAIVRDRFEGRMMAKVASFIMSIFILVPVIAPFIGQVILWVAEWHMIFVMFLLVSLVATSWFALRLNETLPAERRRAFSVSTILDGFRLAATNKITFGYTMCAGAVFGSFQGYLVSSQPIFQGAYQVGDMFAVYFGIPALAIGIAGLINGKIVMKYGMRRLVRIALVATILFALVFGGYSYAIGGVPPLVMFELYLIVTFFCMGMLFGNLNALAMEPMGSMAGIAAAFVGCVSTLVAIPPAALVGQAYSGTVLPLTAGFAVLGVIALAISLWADREHPPGPIVAEA